MTSISTLTFRVLVWSLVTPRPVEDLSNTNDASADVLPYGTMRTFKHRRGGFRGCLPTRGGARVSPVHSVRACVQRTWMVTVDPVTGGHMQIRHVRVA